MKWVPGEEIGHVSFSTVRLGRPKVPSTRFPEIIAVKSSNISNSKMLLHEKSVLMNLQGCPHVIRCFGNDHTKENGEKKYNLFLEYAGGGTLLANLKKQPSRRSQESDVRRYTKSMLQGIKYIHDRGYVHRDLKLENMLVCSSSKGKEDVKIADFGVAKSSGEKKKKKREAELRGTPLYFLPETLSKSEQEPPADVWAFRCMVAEMLSGVPVWRGRPGEDGGALLTRIALAEKMLDMPSDLSTEKRDFLGRIFVKNPAKRWMAQMLLDHPFIADQPCDQDMDSSPKGPLDWNDGYESSQSACTVTKGSLRISTTQKLRSLMMCWISER